MNASWCKYCNAHPAGRCKTCGVSLCKDHLVHDDPFHASGLMRRPADYCNDCYRKTQGTGTTILLLATIAGLGVFIAFMILWGD